MRTLEQIILICIRNANLVGGFHLELVHGLAGLGDIQLVGILAGHSCFLLSICGALLPRPVGYRRHSLCGEKINMPKGAVVIFEREK